MSIEPFNRLVRLAARAFYDDITMKGDNQPKNGRGDNRGMAVVVLDALTRRQWVREEDLAKALKLHSKQLRRTLRFFEEEKLVTRDHRKESAKGSKIFISAVAATVDGQQITKEGEEKLKMHTHSYCCLDYAQIYDIVRYRIHKMKKMLKEKLDNRNTIQVYICPNCGRRYTALDALQLFSPIDELFHCENCNAELAAETDKFANDEMGDGDDNAKRRNQEKLKDMLQKMEEQLKPLITQLTRVRDMPIPEFGSLQAWEARANAAARGNVDLNSNDPSTSSQVQGYGGTPMPYLGETKVEVALSGIEAKEESTETDNKPTELKVLPPWMIREGMNLTKEQRGSKVKTDSSSNQISQISEEEKPKVESQGEKNIQEEYFKAYYAALVQRQQAATATAESNRMQEINNASSSYSEAPSERQVGEKAKRDFEEDNGVEWEEAPPAAKTFKVDLNLEADPSPEEEEDDDDGIDWEEG